MGRPCVIADLYTCVDAQPGGKDLRRVSQVKEGLPCQSLRRSYPTRSQICDRIDVFDCFHFRPIDLCPGQSANTDADTNHNQPTTYRPNPNDSLLPLPPNSCCCCCCASCTFQPERFGNIIRPIADGCLINGAFFFGAIDMFSFCQCFFLGSMAMVF